MISTTATVATASIFIATLTAVFDLASDASKDFSGMRQSQLAYIKAVKYEDDQAMQIHGKALSSACNRIGVAAHAGAALIDKKATFQACPDLE